MMDLLEHGNTHSEFSVLVIYAAILVVVGLAVLGHWLWWRRKERD